MEPGDQTLADTVVQVPVKVRSTTSVVTEDEGRFLPGTLLGGRYRIIGLLGRGGMGEVYRATDLTLGQSVALKFLPEEAARDQRLLERFNGEVRVARQVSHPNVCRVYDIGEVDGTPYISMEYVDGEDLNGLLARIGRLPADKAMQIARKLCAGLAAAHDRGVIHRDLKPHNIMLNKRGEVVIMDFGLAAIADQLTGSESQNGTPAYMAPEQLKGSGVTARSDIYSLGLVFYELFTGKRPYEANNVQQLIERQESLQLGSMTTLAPDVDPKVEKVIRHCLQPDPLKRPSSALAVAAALPGGDPLAAALAAGETPSPEVVAAAGETVGFPLKYAVLCLTVFLACIVAMVWIRQAHYAMMIADAEYSPEVLKQKARDLAASFGYTQKPADSWVSMERRPEMVSALNKLPQPRKFGEWLAAESPYLMQYRESLSELVAEQDGVVRRNNPPPDEPGMVYVQLDGAGRLREFEGSPTARQDSTPVAPGDIFRSAGLDLAKFEEVTPEAIPPHAADQVRAWKGAHPGMPNTPARVEIATWHGTPTMVKTTFPWDSQAKAAQSTPGSALLRIVPAGALVVGFLFAVALARRNWRANRADRKGAFRIAVVRYIISVLTWTGEIHPIPSGDLFGFIVHNLFASVLPAFYVWMLYLALEPALRARWPHAIVTWNRLLAGKWNDAQLHAHFLTGAAAGSAFVILAELVQWWLSERGTIDAGPSLNTVLGVREWVAQHALDAGSAMSFGIVLFFALFGLRVLFRKNWAAGLVGAVILPLLDGGAFRSENVPLMLAIFVAIYGMLLFLLLRYGLIVSIAALFFLNSFSYVMLGANWKTFYTPSGLASGLLLTGMVMYSFWRSLGKAKETELPVWAASAASYNAGVRP